MISTVKKILTTFDDAALVLVQDGTKVKVYANRSKLEELSVGDQLEYVVRGNGLAKAIRHKTQKDLMTDEKWQKLYEFLKPMGYVLVHSCNKDETVYLVPAGTEDQISYSGKPENSYRLSGHWHWKSPKGPGIQCPLEGMPDPGEPNEDGFAPSQCNEYIIAKYEGGLYRRFDFNINQDVKQHTGDVIPGQKNLF